MSYEDILYEQSGHVVTITLNRPDKLNAYTATMGRELADAFNRASADDSCRAIILTGAGRGFCAGADMSAGADAFDTSTGNSASFGNVDEGNMSRRRDSFIDAIYHCNKPTITAYNGAAVGVGLTLSLPTDIKIAADTAKFGFVFARRGLVPEAASAWFLPQLVGMQQALRWCLMGNVFSADEALRGGLVGEVTPPDDLLARAHEIATEIAENCAPVSVALTRKMLWEFGPQQDYRQLEKIDGLLALQLGLGDDVKEGVMSFLEKRPPNFTSKVSTDMPAAYPWTKNDQ